MRPARILASAVSSLDSSSRSLTIGTMRIQILAVLASVFLLPSLQEARAADKDERVYELRTYYAAPGKLDALNARFRDHTCKLFEKHGMTNVGYWTPTDNAENKLVYLLSYPSRKAQEESWKAFLADPDWNKARKESEANGRLVTKVVSLFMTAMDYSPELKEDKEGNRVFELRVYTVTPG